MGSNSVRPGCHFHRSTGVQLWVPQNKMTLLAALLLSMQASASCKTPLLLAFSKDLHDTLLNYLIMHQDFSIPVLLTFWMGSFFIVRGPPVHCRMFSIIPDL